MPREVAPTLHFHPFAAFCQKVLVALYETGIPFERNLVDLGDPDQRVALAALWPFARFPVLVDDGRIIAESTVIIEYLALHHPEARTLVGSDAETAWEIRRRDRFFDLYIADPMQRIVADRLRAPGDRDPTGVAAARALLATACDLLERELAGRAWAAGDAFTMADCAAAPMLRYADMVAPLSPAYPVTAAYLARLQARPSFARVLDEAAPYAGLFPQP